MPFHYLGMAGNVRRYASFSDDFLQPLIPVHQIHHRRGSHYRRGPSSFLSYNLIPQPLLGKASTGQSRGRLLRWSGARRRRRLFDNFGGKHPVVYHDPYQYGVKSSVGDYVMQTSPEQVETEHDEK